jgi:hypothetical protein
MRLVAAVVDPVRAQRTDLALTRAAVVPARWGARANLQA